VGTARCCAVVWLLSCVPACATHRACNGLFVEQLKQWGAAAAVLFRLTWLPPCKIDA
jgi:hypothetical protein